MRELLSSRSTPLFRNVFPAAWSVMFGLGSIAVWVLPGGENPPPLAVKFMFPVIWAVGSVVIFWVTRRMRTVWLDDDTLVVGAGQEEWMIPLAAVEEIKERRHRNPPTILISARGPTGELVKVHFIPGIAMRLPFKPHPTTVRLRAEVDAARAALPRTR